MAEIRVESADGAARRVTLDKERFTIGRSRENDIFLPDQWLSQSVICEVFNQRYIKYHQ